MLGSSSLLPIAVHCSPEPVMFVGLLERLWECGFLPPRSSGCSIRHEEWLVLRLGALTCQLWVCVRKRVFMQRTLGCSSSAFDTAISPVEIQQGHVALFSRFWLVAQRLREYHKECLVPDVPKFCQTISLFTLLQLAFREEASSLMPGLQTHTVFGFEGYP